MKKLSKVEAETYASKLNGKQLLDITRKVVAMSGVENIIKTDSGTEVDIDSLLVVCSKEEDVFGNKKGSHSSCVVFSSYFDDFQSCIDMIDMFLNIQKGNVISNGFFVTIKRRNNQLTKLFNKVLRETIVEDYPEVCI